MILSDVSVRRPIAMSCLIIALALLGVNSFRKMGLESMPKMDLPYITIVTTYPGASPTQIETDVAKRIEDAVVTIDGLKHVTSSCMENVCQTLLEFNLGVDVDIAATDVREKIDLIRADFPEDVDDPIIQKFDINAKPIVTLALKGDAPLDELYDFAANDLKDRITVISGVAEVQLIGGAEREVHVLLDRRKLAARGLSSVSVVQMLQGNLGAIPSGRVRESGAEYAVKFDADFDTPEGIGRLEIANKDGQRCYLRDVASVAMATEELRQKANVDGHPCVAIRVVKKSDANAVAVTNAVRQAMAALKATLPAAMDLVWVTDDGRFIEANNESAWMNVAQGVLLTAAILFLFLYDLRSLLVVAMTMPLTIVIGVFFMQIAGFTFNTSTLIAIGMSVGVLVTNSIVVLEAIVSHFKETGDAKESARLGAKESWVAVLASAGTNVVVLFPLAMMSSTVGLFIRPLALTMFIMTVVSLFISFTLTPLLCSVLMRAPSSGGHLSWLGRAERAWNRGFDWVTGRFRGLLEFNERHRLAAIGLLGLVALMFFHAMSLGGKMGSSMVADSDKGEIFVKLEFSTSYDLNRTEERVADAERRLRDLPELRHILSTIGKVEGVIGQSSEGVYLAQVLLKFSERTERELTIDHLLDMVRDKLKDYPGAISTVSIPSMVGGQNNPIEIEIAGAELGVLDRLALDFQREAGAIPGVVNPDTTVRAGKPELRIRPRRETLADMGGTAWALGMNLRANLEGLTAGTFKQNARNYDIVVKYEEEEGKEQVAGFLFPGDPGHPLVLYSVAQVEEGRAPVMVTRKDKQRIAKVLSNLEPSLPLGTAVSKISETVTSKVSMPPGYDYAFSGIYEKMAEGQSDLGEAGLIAIVLLVLTLAAILESFRQPVLILVTVPLALIGTMWALYIGGESFGIFVIMGVVMMIGIVVNNAILIIDQFNVHVAEGVPRHKAMISATCERFRPIVMITLAAVLGMLPLALGRGIGAEMRTGVGVASVGGILVSGVLTLFVLPVLYDLFTRGGRGARGR